MGLAFNGKGRLWIGDFGKNRLFRLTIKSGEVELLSSEELSGPENVAVHGRSTSALRRHRMKRFIAIGLVTFMLAGFVSGQTAQTGESSITESLTSLEKQSWEAWQKRDGKFFQHFLSDDHLEVGFNGPATKAQVVAFVGSPTCTVKNYSVDKFKVVMLDEKTAVVTYHAEQDITCNGTAVPSPVWVSSLYVKRDGRWLNALYQQTQASK
jgi:hypothetical protein